jgi:hypothetical protein
METEHPDLFHDAAQVALRDVVELGSFIMAAGRVVIRHQAQVKRAREQRSEKARRALKAQIRAERAAVRARWAPANDPRWLREASLTDTAVAWCVAVPYADPSTEWFERSAESAVRNCERRLRELHPHAMARYDRLRGDGLHPVLAMGKAAPLFQRSPDVRAHGTQPRSGALTRGSGLDHSWAAAEHGPSREEFEAHVTAGKYERRGRQVAWGLQGRAMERDLPPLGEAEQRTALESATNLPVGAIKKLAVPEPPAGRPSRRPWVHDFPVPIEQVLAAIAAHGTDGRPAVPPARIPAAGPGKHPQPARRTPR